MSSATVRISPPVHKKLKRIAAPRRNIVRTPWKWPWNRSAGKCYRESGDYAALRSDPERWAEEQEKRAAWEANLANGLEEP